MTLLALFGGLALLLYGMQLIGEGLQRAAGGHLRHLLTSMTRTRLAAVASGALVTAIIQSSSATTLMLIGFVSAGLVTFRQSLGVILGADIGTTVTVQLLAFKVQELSLLLVGVGFAIDLLRAPGPGEEPGPGGPGLRLHLPRHEGDERRRSPRSPRTSSRARCWWPWPTTRSSALLVGAVLSASMASSAATIGLTLSLGHQGLLPLGAAIPVVLGANIGTCATALAASLRSSADARAGGGRPHRVQGARGRARLPVHRRRSRAWSPQTAGDAARQIANAHTLLQRGDQRALPAVRAVGGARHHGAGAGGRSGATIRSARATSTTASSTSRPSPSGRRRARPCAWATWPRACCATRWSCSAPTTRSCWRTWSGATTSSTTSSARSSSSWRGSGGRP